MQELKNTTSIAVPPLTKAVLHPVLRALTDSNRLDFTQLTDRMYLQPIVTGGVKELDRAISTKRFFSLSSNTANNVYLLIIGGAFSLLQNSSPGEIVNKILFAGVMMATMQMSAIIGTEPNTGRDEDGFISFGTTKFSEAQYGEYLTLINNTAVLIINEFPVSARTLEECDEKCEKIAIDFHSSSSSPLKGSQIKAMYFIGLRPFVRALYVGMFCKDDRLINQSTGQPLVRPDSTVYDSRTAEMLLMTAATQIIFILLNELENIASDANIAVQLSPMLMKTFMNTIVHFYARQDVTTGDHAIMAMYKKVVNISKTNEKLRSYVLRGNNELMVRKEDAMTMYRNMELSKKRTSASKSYYMFWIITLLVYIISAFIVNLKGSSIDVYWMNGIVFALLAIGLF
jgi:hypothetical protein